MRLCVVFVVHDVGNKLTLETKPQELGVDVREELLQFHSRHYSSNIMALVVLGKGGRGTRYMAAGGGGGHQLVYARL